MLPCLTWCGVWNSDLQATSWMTYILRLSLILFYDLNTKEILLSPKEENVAETTDWVYDLEAAPWGIITEDYSKTLPSFPGTELQRLLRLTLRV